LPTRTVEEIMVFVFFNGMSVAYQTPIDVDKFRGVFTTSSIAVMHSAPTNSRYQALSRGLSVAECKRVLH